MSPHDSTLAQELLQHEDFLRRLARGLVGAEGEDLVQDVWERALSRPPAQRSDVRAWLATVARNLARNRARARGRRLAREQRAAERSSEVTPDEVEERFELCRQVVQALDGLPEPFRGTLILRYFEDLAPEAIAARQEVPLATVKSRIARGLARLRAELDVRHAGDRRAWLGGMIGWLRGDAAAASTTVGVAGGLFMGTMGKVVLGAAVLGAALVLAERVRSTADGDLERESVARPVAHAGGEVAPAAAGSEAHPPGVAASVALAPAPLALERTETVAPEAASALARFVVLGRIGGANAAECEGVRVLASGIQHGASWPAELFVEGRGRADGSYELDVGRLFDHGRTELELEELQLRFDHPRFCPAELRVLASAGRENASGQTVFTADAELLEAAVVHGVLLRPDGGAASGGLAAAFQVREGEPVTPEADAVDCAADGRFVLRVHVDGSVLVALADGPARPSTLAVEVAVGSSVDVGAIRLEEGVALAGFALSNGAPLSNARVELRPETPGEPCGLARPSGVVPLRWSGARFELGRSWRRTDGDGSFVFGGLAPEAFALSVVDGAGARAALPGPRPERVVRAPLDGVRLEHGWAMLRFEFSGERDPGDGLLALESRSGRADFTLRGADAWTLEVPPDEDVEGFVSFPGCARVPFGLRTPASGAEAVVPIALVRGVEPARLVLALEVPEGHTVSELALSFAAPGEREDRPLIRVVPVEDGMARVDELAPGRYDVRVRTGERFELATSPFLEERFELDLAPGDEVRRALALRAGAGLRLTVRDDSGALVGCSYQLLDERGAAVELPLRVYRDANVFETRFRVLPFGVNEACPLLAPGRYELVLAEAGFVEERVSLELVAGETCELEVILRRE